MPALLLDEALGQDLADLDEVGLGVREGAVEAAERQRRVAQDLGGLGVLGGRKRAQIHLHRFGGPDKKGSAAERTNRGPIRFSFCENTVIMKIDVIRESSGNYTVKASSAVAASARDVIATFMDPEKSEVKLRDVRSCAAWEPQADGSIFVRYKMKPPALDFDMYLKKEGAHEVKFWTPDNSWCVIRGTWRVRPVFFGRSFVSLEQTIEIRSAWLRALPIQPVIKGRVKNAFEDLREEPRTFLERLFSCVRPAAVL